MKSSANNKGRFDLEALEPRVMLSGDSVMAAAIAGAVAHPHKQIEVVHEQVETSSTGINDSIAYASESGSSDIFSGVMAEGIESNIDSSSAQTTAPVNATGDSTTGSNTTEAPTATVTVQSEIAVSSSATTTTATSNQPISPVNTATSASTVTEQLTTTLNAANAPPASSSESQVSANQNVSSNSSSSQNSTVTSFATPQATQSTTDLLSDILSALNNIASGGSQLSVNLGNVTLADVLAINDVTLSFSNLAITNGSVTAGTVTIQTGMASLTLGSAVTSSIDSITGSYDIASKTFSLTLGSGSPGAINIGFSSYVNITAANASLTYVAAGATDVTLSNSSSASVSLLTIGISGATIFAGLNGPASNPNAVGVELDNANLALALMSTDDGMVYYGVAANATAIQGVGLPNDIQVGVGDLDVQINGASDGGTTVVNYSASFTTSTNDPGLDISGTSLVLDYDQYLIRVAGSLNLSVTDYIEISGGFSFTKTANAIQIDVGSSAYDGADPLTFSLGSFFSASGNLSMVIDANSITINQASLTVNEKFTIGSILEVSSPGVGVSNIVIDRLTGVLSGSDAGDPTIEITAGSASLFPGNNSISASVSASPTNPSGNGLDAKFDLITGAFNIHIDEFELAVGTVLTAHASDATISYNPADSDPHQQLVQITEGTVDFNKFNITGDLTGLTIYADGFAFDSITVTYNGSIKLGTFLTLNSPSVTLTDFAVTFAGGNASVNETGSLTVAVDSGSMTVASIAVNVTDLSITVGLDPATNLGDVTVKAGSLNLAFSSYVTIAATDITINTSPAVGDAYFEVKTATATLAFKSIVLSGTASNFSVVNADANGTPGFEAGLNFSVGFSASAQDLGLPVWIDFTVQKFVIQWPDFNNDPGNFKLILSASIDGIQGLPGNVQVSGEISDAVIDIGKLQQGQFPIVSIGSVGGGVSGELFGMEVNAGFILGIVNFNAAGEIVDGSGNVYQLTTDSKGKAVETQITDNPDTRVVNSVLYVGVEGGAQIPGVGGVQIYIGFSSLGPLTLFMSAQFPLIIEPTTGIAIEGFSGGITFNYEIPTPQSPEDLANVSLSPDDMTVAQWQQQLRDQTVLQYNATSGGTNLFAAYTNPFVITASVSLYDAYATSASFVIKGTIGIEIKPLDPTDINIFLKGTATVGGTVDFDASFYLHIAADINDPLASTYTMMFLAQVPSQPYTYESFGGSFQVGFTDANGVAITLPANPSQTFAEWIALAAAYDNNGSATIKDLPVGTYTWTPGSGDVSLTVDGHTYNAVDGSATFTTANVSDVVLAGTAKMAITGTLASVSANGSLPSGAQYLVTTFAPQQSLGGFYIQLTGFLKYQVPLVPDINMSINGSILLTVTTTKMKLDVWGDLNVSFLGDIAVARGEFVLDYGNLIDVGLPVNVPQFYGALVIQPGAGLIALQQYGLTVSGSLMLQINLTGTDQVVNLPNAPPTAEPTGNETPLNSSDSSAFTVAGGAFFDVTLLGAYPNDATYATVSYGIAGITLFDMQGYFDFRLAYDATAGVQLQMFAEIKAFTIGSSATSPGDALLSFSGFGMFVINSNGLAAEVNLNLASTDNHIPGITFAGNYTLVINTTSQDVTFTIPAPPGTTSGNSSAPSLFVYDANGNVVGEATTLVIPAGPPVGLATLDTNTSTASFSVTGATGPYIVIAGNGKLTLLNSLELDGLFRFELSYNSTDGLILSVIVNATADLSTVSGAADAGLSGAGSVAVTGALQIVTSGAHQGVAALLAVGASTSSSQTYGNYAGGVGMMLTANFQLAINTTDQDISSIGGVALKDQNNNTITLSAGSIQMLGTGSLDIYIGSAHFLISGSIFASTDSTGTTIAVNGVVTASVGNVTLLTMNATGVLVVDNNGLIAGDLSMSVLANNPLNGTGFYFSGNFDLRVNTTLTATSVANPLGGADIVLAAGANGSTTGAVYAEIRASGTMVFGTATNGFQIQNTFFYLSLSNQGFVISASGNLAVVIGGSTLFSLNGSAAMLISSQGIAASLTVTATVGGSNSYYGFSGTFNFQVNTTGQSVSIPNGPTISALPGYSGAVAGPYIQLWINGTMALGGTSTSASSGLFLNGDFYLTISAAGLAVTASSTLNLKVGGTTFFTLTADGALLITSQGIAAQISLTAGTKLPGDSSFNFSLTLTLKVNTTNTNITSINGKGVSLSATDAFGNTHYFDLSGTGTLKLGNVVNISGSFTFAVGSNGVLMMINGSVNVMGVVFTINVQAGIYSNGVEIHAVLSIGSGGTVATFLNGLITVNAQFVLDVNTSSTQSHFGVATNTPFALHIHSTSGSGDAQIYILGFQLAGSFDITIHNGGFQASGSISFDFFGFATLSIAMLFDSSGDYYFVGHIYVQLGSDSFNIHGDLTVIFASTSEFGQTVNGVYIDSNFKLHVSGGATAFHIDFASISADVSISGTSVDISVRVTVLGIGKTIHIHLGSLVGAPTPPPPNLGYVLNGVFYLNVTFSGENYEITENGNGTITVYDPGISSQTVTYTASSIHIDLTGFNDSTVTIYDDNDAHLPVTIISGGGSNAFFLGGGVSTVTGTSGNDLVVGGTGNVTFNAGTGSSTFIGGGTGSTHNVINDPGSVTVVESGYASYSLVGTSSTSAVLTYGGNTDTLNGTDITVTLTAPNSGASTFAVTDYFGAVTFNANGNSTVTTSIAVTSANLSVTGNVITESNGVTGTITLQNNDGTTNYAYGPLNLYGGSGDNTLTINNWSGGLVTMDGKDGNDTYVVNFQTSGSLSAVINDSGASGTDTLIINGTTGNDVIKIYTNSVTLGTQSVNYSGLENLTVYTKAGNDTINLIDTAIATTINGGSGTNVYNILSTHAAVTINGGSGNDSFYVFGNAATLTLNGQGGTDVFYVMASVLTGSQNYQANAQLNIDGGAGTPATLNIYGTVLNDAITISGTNFTSMGLNIAFANITGWTVSGLDGNDTFYVQSVVVPLILSGDGSLPVWMLSSGVTAPDLTGGNAATTFDDTFYVGWRGVDTAGSLSAITRSLTLVGGAGNDVAYVDDSADTGNRNFVLTPGQLVGDVMGAGGRIVYDSSLETLNIQFGSGDDTLAINDMIATTVTTIDGGSGSNSATMTFSGDFSATDLTLLNFQNNTLSVVGDFTGLLNDQGAFSTVVIGGSMTESGVFNAGSIDSMKLGGDLAGLLNVTGLLNTLAIGGGTPGKIIAGSINYISVQSAYGNKVFQVIEGGIERQIQASPVDGGDMPDSIRFAFLYDSSAPGDPQVVMSITNNGEVTPRSFNLLFAVLDAQAQFNLGLVYASAATGLSNLSVEGDILFAASQTGLDFLGLPVDTRTGVVLPFDYITGVEVSGILPIGMVEVAGIEGVAFGLLETTNGQVVNILGDLRASGKIPKVLWNLLGSQPVLMAATDTFVVPFSSSHSVQIFAQCNTNQTLEYVMTLSASNNDGVTDIATVVILPNNKQPHVQSINIAGDGASVDSRYGVGTITSTGSIGNVTIRGKEGLGSITASGIFGNINVTAGAITGTIETTGIRIDPVTGEQTSVNADIGSFTYNAKGDISGVTTIFARKGFTGDMAIICRGDLVSYVNVKGVFNGLIAVQGNIGAVLTDPLGSVILDNSGRLTRFGGLSIAKMTGGQIIVLGNTFGDISIRGSFAGRIAVQGAEVSGLDAARTGILGNLYVRSGIAASGAIISGGLIGDAAGGTKLTSGRIKGFLAANGDINLANSRVIASTNLFADSQSNADGSVLDAIFTDQSVLLNFDTGGPLAGLALIQSDLAAIGIVDGELSGTTP